MGKPDPRAQRLKSLSPTLRNSRVGRRAGVLGNQHTQIWGWRQGATGSQEEVMREGHSSSAGPRPPAGQESGGGGSGEAEGLGGLRDPGTGGSRALEDQIRDRQRPPGTKEQEGGEEQGQGAGARSGGGELLPSLPSQPFKSTKHALHTHCHLLNCGQPCPAATPRQKPLGTLAPPCLPLPGPATT